MSRPLEVMKARLAGCLLPDQWVAEVAQPHIQRLIFLRAFLILSPLLATVIGLYRWQQHWLLGTIDFSYSLACVGLFHQLRKHPLKIEWVVNGTLAIGYGLCTAMYLLAPYNKMRLSLFFLLSAAAFFLKGRRIGLAWLVGILTTIVLVHLANGALTDYPSFDIVISCLCLVGLFVILENYEIIHNEQWTGTKAYLLQRQLDERWRLALESAGDAVWEWDIPSGNILFSKGFSAMLGYGEGELGHQIDDLTRLLHPHDVERSQALLNTFLSGQGPDLYDDEFRVRRRDGTYTWILRRGRIIQFTPDGKPQRMIGTHVDITERKQMEASLKESEKRLQLAMDAARMGAWEFEISTNRLYWSPEVFRLFGLSPQVPSMETFWSLIHPDDAHQVQKAMDRAMNERVPFVTEFRIPRPDKLLWAEDRGEVQYDLAGNPVRVIGTVQEITRRKLAEQEILRSRQALADERRLFQTILDNAPMGVWMLGTDHRLRFVNRRFCQTTGIDEQAFLSAEPYTKALPLSITASFQKADQECLGQESPHVSLKWLPFGDGREHLLEITRIRLADQAGEIKGLMALAADVTQRMEHQKQLEHIAHYDALTGAPNRLLLADRLTQALARTQREKNLMALCYLDLDGFKGINDSFGHETGDRILVEITRRIRASVRQDDTLARIGGDEFVVLLVGLQAPEECPVSLNRLLEAINAPIRAGTALVNLSCSIGVALYPADDEQDAETLLRHADQAMYLAKQSGKNRYHLFDPASDHRARSHHALLQQIRCGLKRGEFELYYQPKVEVGSGRLMGVEALLRWNHPQRGLLAPDEFLRAIENSDLELELGEWVLDTAIRQLNHWRAVGLNLEVSVNVSAYHLQSPRFVEKLRGRIASHAPPGGPGRLQIEVLETAALEDIAGISSIIKQCKEFGLRFALDDFGTGYSSLSYLSKFDVDVLKIDQSFIRDMAEDQGDHAIVQGIVALAKAFDLGTVAEGVETDVHYQTLLHMGCEWVQGYGIARPMPVADLIQWSATRLNA